MSPFGPRPAPRRARFQRWREKNRRFDLNFRSALPLSVRDLRPGPRSGPVLLRTGCPGRP
ncbi:uncharacterized protein BCN122_I0575 [Burkholderia cenocepacia]|nr:uncharacterized protein BCN122_I0575 [Burkholderia cenocepacia]